MKQARKALAIILLCVGCGVVAQKLPDELPRQIAVSAIDEKSFPEEQLNQRYRGAHLHIVAFGVTVDDASNLVSIVPVEDQTPPRSSPNSKSLSLLRSN